MKKVFFFLLVMATFDSVLSSGNYAVSKSLCKTKLPTKHCSLNFSRLVTGYSDSIQLQEQLHLKQEFSVLKSNSQDT